MKKRILTLLLTLVLLLGVLCSCKSNVPDVEDTSELFVSTNESETNDNSEAPIAIMDDFGGYNFTVLTRKGSWESNDITASATGNSLDQAVFTRNETLSSKYNFKIVEIKDNKWVETAKIQGESGVHSYDMWSFRMNDMPALAQSGYMLNLNEVSGLNLDASYYDQSLRKQGSFANHLFFLNGDMMYMDDCATGGFFVNHTVWSTYKLTEKYGKDIYQIVKDGQWTLETLEQCCKVVSHDETGDGIMNEKDVWGFSCDGWLTLSMNIGIGNELLQKDQSDVFTLNNSEKQLNDMQTLIEFLTSANVAPFDYTKSATIFNDDRQLFRESQLTNLPALSQTNVDYGVLPYPKHDAVDQTAYYSFVSTYGANAITIPSTVPDVDKVANIIELISYESQQIVTPQFNKYLFDGRVTQRVEDSEMLDLIFSNRKYEICYLWSTGGLYTSMQALLSTEGADIASTFKSLETSVSESVARKLERIEQLT